MIDFIGAALLGIGLGSILYALVHGHTLGWWTASTSTSLLGNSPVPWLLICSGILVILAFPTWVRHLERRNREPVFDVGRLDFHSFRGGILASLARQVAQFAPVYTLAIFLEDEAG